MKTKIIVSAIVIIGSGLFFAMYAHADDCSAERIALENCQRVMDGGACNSDQIFLDSCLANIAASNTSGGSDADTQAMANCINSGGQWQSDVNACRWATGDNAQTQAGCESSGGQWDSQIGTCMWTTGGNSGSSAGTQAGCISSGGQWDSQIGTCRWTTGGNNGGSGGSGSGSGSSYGSSLSGSGSGSGGTSACSGDVIAGVCFPEVQGMSKATVGQILTTLLNWLLGIFVTIAIIAFLISGIQYLTAAGDEGQIDTAKTNMKWSIVGVLVGLSGFIVLQAAQTFLNGTTSYF